MTGRLPELVDQLAPSIARVYVASPDKDGRMVKSFGSGFLWGAGEGGRSLVITNAHVIRVQEGSRHALGFGVRGELITDVRLVGWHPWVDIAVLSADLESTPQPLRFRDLSARMGEDCVVLGFPWRMDLSVARGIVSGLDRDTELGPALFPLRWLQADVMINEGNSGGPMVDAEGSVIGVAAMGLADLAVEQVEYQDREAELIRRRVRADGINLFVPGDLAEAAIEGILGQDGGGIPVGDEGIDFDREFWSSFVQDTNLPTLRDRPGLVAVRVRDGSPAFQAGIEVGDSIVRIGEMEVDHPADLFAWRIGSDSWKVDSEFRIWRAGDEFTVSLRAEESRVDPSAYEGRLIEMQQSRG